jgi:hypothetical protein
MIKCNVENAEFLSLYFGGIFCYQRVEFGGKKTINNSMGKKLNTRGR